jgi:DNA/RNA-binding domain of Phe-tRNA-synthetase-like protein
LPIVNEDIIDLNEKITLKFEEKSEKYLNTKLKADLIEGEHF